MLGSSIRIVLLALVALAALVYCEEEMNLNVAMVEDPKNDVSEEESSELVDESKQAAEDLCLYVKCGAGEMCVINDGEAYCECIELCEIPNDHRQQICTTANKTFESDCHFLRQKCWCNKKDAKCTDTSILEEKLDYYGACQDIGLCSADQKEVFPLRMQIWLDEVLHILNERKDLEPKYKTLVQMADEMKANHTEKYWTCGVAFEFCQLDKSNDHIIQKEELRALVASIKALENCIQPFLDACDTDKSDDISDKEWATCLDLSDDDLELLRKHC